MGNESGPTGRELGRCEWNGNEIVQCGDPNRGVAGLAHDACEEWGHIFAAAPELLAALELIEDRLGFLEGTEEVLSEGGRKQVIVNAQGDDGDFQEMLAKARDAIASAKATR